MICVLRLSFFGYTGAYVLFVVATDGTEEHMKELQELLVAAQTVVESVGSAEEYDGSLADRLQKVPQMFAEYLVEASRNCVA